MTGREDHGDPRNPLFADLRKHQMPIEKRRRRSDARGPGAGNAGKFGNQGLSLQRCYPLDPQMTDGKLLCLNMIVRNETANLERCLSAVADHIACWVIGDTGSTDDTPDFIKSFFAARGLPGELHSFPFENFEQARNAALDRAQATPIAYDYLLLADADMELVVEDRGFRAGLEAPGYLLIQRTHSGLTYWNTRLVRRNLGTRYRGVTHEYLDVPGGVKELRGAWYWDHGTGSNRTDKFERDIRLLTTALEQEPENSRYWFYLAQSYRDAGRTEEAAKAYAKRAEMGGWDEEAWHARLEQARCLRTLGNEGGFLRQALAAFNQRPQRAEPLYDLARFYRERGMNEASVLFAEAALAVPRPDRDILFLEDSVYGWGLQEEYSIAANYSRDAARKDRGHAACNWLALNREIPAGSRNLARSNLLFYLAAAGAMMPSFAARPVGFTPPDGYRPLNPSVARWGEQIVLVQRSVNFTLTEDGDYRTPDGAPIRTRNFLLHLADDLAIRSATEILPPVDLPEPAYALVQGFEDLRPFAWRGGLWCCACVRQLTPEGWCEQVLARIDDGAPGGCRLTDWRVLHPEGARLHEKNWMPLVAGETLRLIYRCDPTRVVDEQARTIAETTPAIAADHFSGGSQLIPFDGGWLALIHQTTAGASPGRRHYQHRFVWLDKTNVLRRVSRAFFFRQKGVEYAAGLAWHPDGKRLLVSYGVGDGEAWMATVDAGEVGGVLEDAQHLPSGAPGSGRGPARPRPAPGEAASGNLKPIIKAARSAWVPAAAAAGTELMVAGLKQRLGRELETIALTVNHPGPVTGDARPRVVWVHHDTNQAYMQWCRDKVLVDSVDCFVFVSYWQRERYLADFGLPPERCVVLHNATDVDPTPRPWAPGPIWRCAYASTPFRGLSVLLDAWERLRPNDAELHIWSSMKLYLQDDSPYLRLYEKAEALPGVIYHGIVPNPDLRAALRTIHFLTYPSTFAETSCLAVIEAMAAGCRVIVPSLGALPETTGGYAHVYPYSAATTVHAALFADALRHELSRPWAGAPEVAVTQQRHCAAVYDWRSRVGEWRQLIGTVSGRSGRLRAAGAA
jgi:glycosyltransferase involved in cell wall biosynthesis/tetratricopeptide (TPR) repeat protein